MGKVIKYGLIIAMIQLMLLCVLVRPSYVIKVMAAEGIKIEDTLGANTLQTVDRYSSDMFNRMFIKSGVYATAWHMLVPTRGEHAQSNQIRLFNGIELWVQDRINLMFTLIFLLCHRLTLMSLWLTSATEILIMSAVTGVLLRRIKQSNFAFASPTAHRVSIRILLVVIILAPFILSVPIAINPYIYPIAFLIMAFMIQAIIANVAKRI